MFMKIAAYALVLAFPAVVFYNMAEWQNGRKAYHAIASAPTHYNEDWQGLVSGSKEDILCLAGNIYFEARGVSIADQIAVAQVTLNRVASGHYPGTVCGVVFQPHQFSWTGDASIMHHAIDYKAWALAKRVASAVLANAVTDNTHGAMYYYNPAKAHPAWARHGYDTVRMQGHIYMKLAGL